MTGVALAVLAAGFATSKDIVSKKLASSVDGNTSAFASFLFALPVYALVLLALWLMGIETFATTTAFWFFVGARALSDAVAETSKMHALTHGELSVISSITALHPIFMLVTSPLITGDPVTPLIAVGVVVSVAGTFVITFDKATPTSRKGIMFALVSAVFFSINTSLDRVTVQGASPTLSGFVMTALACLLIAPLMRSKNVSLLLRNQRAFLARGLFEAAFMVVKLSALMYISAPELSAVTRLSLIFSVISGNVVFKEVHFARKMFGATLTVAGVMIVLLHNA